MRCCDGDVVVDGESSTPDASSSTSYVDTSPLDVTADTSQRTIAGHTFAAASLPYTNALVRIGARCSFTNRVNGTLVQQTWAFSFGGVVLWQASWNTTGATLWVPRPLRFDFELLIQSQTFQLLSGWVTEWQGTPPPTAGAGIANASNESNQSSLGCLDPVISGGGSTRDLAAAQAFALTYQANNASPSLHLVRYGAWAELLRG